MSTRRIGAAYRFAAGVLRPPLAAFTRREWQGMEHLPAEGGFVVCANHMSHVDPLVMAHFLHDQGIPPRFLAKASLFKGRVVGPVLRGAGQIPVYRDTADAGKAFSAAVAAVERGEAVVIYPEATLTRDPDLWPMSGKTGAARVALTTGCPVIPVAQWGAQEILPPYAKKPMLFPRRTIRILAGPPVDLSPFEGHLDATSLRGATDAILDDITVLLEKVRGEKAPPRRIDGRAARAGKAATTTPADAADAPTTPADDDPQGATA